MDHRPGGGYLIDSASVMADLPSWNYPGAFSEAWFEEAACRGMPITAFFPGSGVRPVEALDACALCPVRGECLEWALTHHVHWGVWGGMTERDRFREKRRRRHRVMVEASRVVEVESRPS